MSVYIEEIKRRMLVKYPFFGSVIANVNYKENFEISTAGTDGKTIYYNSNYLKKLNSQEQVFIFAHEVCHIAFNHILRSEGKIHKLWNIATDAVINQLLKKDGLSIVTGGVDIKEAINYDAEELYEKLLKDQKDKPNKGEENNDVGHDTHSMWNEAVKKHKDEQKGNQNVQEENANTSQENDSREEETAKNQKEIQQQQQHNNNNNNNNTNENSKIDELTEEITKISQKGEREAFKENLQERKDALEKLKQALAEQVMQAGNTTKGNERVVSDIGRSRPIIDWRYYLRETTKYVDWSYKNAYIEDGVVCANLEERPIPEIEIVLDTSGSINETLLKNFLKECKNILKCSKLKVGCFDTKFYGFQEIRTEKDIENMKFEGGGGTNFDVAVNAFTKRVDNKIIFTDGCANMPQKNMKIIWVVFGERRINPPGGKVIMINKEQLSKLYNFEKGYSRKRSL